MQGRIERDGRRIATFVLCGMAAVFLLVGVIFIKVAVGLDATAARLEASGVETMAKVVERRIATRRETDRDGFQRTTTDHFVTLTYATGTGERIEVEELVGADRYHALPEGTDIAVIYLPDDPKVMEFEHGETKGEAGIFRWIGRGLAALGLVLAAVAGWLWRRPAGP